MKSAEHTLKRHPPSQRLPASASLALACLLLALSGGQALARKSDRDLPLNIEADSVTGVLDADGTATITGNVRISQGSMDVHADVATITRVAGDFDKVVFDGKPARLNQVNDDGTPMQAQANRIDYNVAKDIVVLTGAVVVVQERGTLTGERITYNLDSGELSGSSGGKESGRIQMKILPKNKPASKEGG
ncbi:MAG: lipopolysaccharide transport periplasmic protein LptA [Lysobacterales bacterium CG17_big_fil_post_rev_8_21_14_2_50_64_11]|nr:MAG: lipopolysaccharide transport periplasmic protein LptA [Xanthomonadales bacterium CG17_big_fil_post_rev_8_21_14_2_50_64_11]PIX61678.1 MAG: lipopolysaccharide transport periplasmic protein LptA [Xanthomonadales bacterium CG_4_10_14_3_um_filter_64_11]